ncbi:RDD family protein [Alteromonas sp. AMM-1]|uniref:RDD family protein n=1 Tax=Alteromonas sp. AMM-1 TaxID=3394233 RepID=UPI0039A73126
MAKSKKSKKVNAPKSSPSVTAESSKQQRAGFLRRLAAMIYDTLVATAVGMCAAMVMIVFMVVSLKNGLFDMQGYAEPNEFIQHSLLFTTIIQVWVGLWIAGFFLWFWKRGGQTLGMRAWRLRIFSTNELPMTWSRLLLRLVASLGGLGTLLVLFDLKNKQSLQDRVANTEVLTLTKNQNDHKSW